MSKEIKLSQGQIAIVDDEDYERVNKYKWSAKKDGNVVYATKYNRFMHSYILDVPKGTRLDHRNGNGLDNRKQNLRIATNSQNAANTFHPKGTSKYKGVSWYQRMKKWRARIKCNQKNFHIGYFDDEEQAARAYDEKAREFFKEFARTNF